MTWFRKNMQWARHWWLRWQQQNCILTLYVCYIQGRKPSWSVPVSFLACFCIQMGMLCFPEKKCPFPNNPHRKHLKRCFLGTRHSAKRLKGINRLSPPQAHHPHFTNEENEARSLHTDGGKAQNQTQAVCVLSITLSCRIVGGGWRRWYIRVKNDVCRP